jgi:hypothetical protein
MKQVPQDFLKVNVSDLSDTLAHLRRSADIIERLARDLHSRNATTGVPAARHAESMTNAIRWWLSATPKQRMDYKATKATSTTDIMPVAFFRNRLKRVASYRDDRRGADTAIKAQLDLYCEMGYLRELSREESLKMGSTIGGLYAIGREFPG